MQSVGIGTGYIRWKREGQREKVQGETSRIWAASREHV